MYQYTPDEIDHQRAHHQARKQGADDLDTKRIGNLGELAFEQFCREYLPVELWEWKNAEALRWCVPESFSAYDFELYGYQIDVKTSRDVSAFLPNRLLENDPDDDIVVMVWHRDIEDSLILLGWERLETLRSKVDSQDQYSGKEPEKLAHLAARPLNELLELGPNTAFMNQKPQNPHRPGDRVVGAEDPEAQVAVVVDVLPPEEEAGVYGQTIDGEAIHVAYPASLDEGPGDWRAIHPALLASYCKDQSIKLYTYKHTNLEAASNPFVVGDQVVKTDHDEPDVALVVTRDEGEVSVAFLQQIGHDDLAISNVPSYCEKHDIKLYSYPPNELAFANITN